MSTLQLQSFIGGRWVGSEAAQTLRSAINGQPVARTHTEAIDFGAARACRACSS
jgi:oxepin-CoA hydrolase/3-oxo-5,6-dehydrosuberyl-CoA semialdehyde dehydrogenase